MSHALVAAILVGHGHPIYLAAFLISLTIVIVQWGDFITAGRAS